MPEINVRAAAGPEAWNEEPERTKETWLLADPLIRHEFRARPQDLRMITVDGDSMEPLLSSGDRILIDMSRQLPVPPGIFVISRVNGARRLPVVSTRLKHSKSTVNTWPHVTRTGAARRPSRTPA